MSKSIQGSWICHLVLSAAYAYNKKKALSNSRTHDMQWLRVQPLHFNRNLICSRPSFLNESCLWLIANGRIDEAVSILKKIAKVNGRQVDEEVFDNFKVRSNALYQGILTLILKYQYGWPPHLYWLGQGCFEIEKNCFMQWCCDAADS